MGAEKEGLPSWRWEGGAIGESNCQVINGSSTGSPHVLATPAARQPRPFHPLDEPQISP